MQYLSQLEKYIYLVKSEVQDDFTITVLDLILNKIHSMQDEYIEGLIKSIDDEKCKIDK